MGIKCEDGLFFHEQCIICVCCHEPLQKRSFTLYKENVLCDRCLYVAYGKMCDFCNEPIEPNDCAFKYRCLIFHSDCFKCKMCKSDLSKSQCMVDELKELYCLKCYVKIVSNECTFCNKPIENKGIVFENVPYHQSCFKCGKCEDPIVDAFYLNHDDSEALRICEWCLIAENSCQDCGLHFSIEGQLLKTFREQSPDRSVIR
ncbi:hypothetical protein ACOME3_006934 [Neoechinorhynchus agilis]